MGNSSGITTVANSQNNISIFVSSHFHYHSMKEKRLVIYGIGKFAQYVSYVFAKDSPYEICGFCIESTIKSKNTSDLFGLPLVNFEKLEENFPPEEFHLFIAVGNNLIRERLFTQARNRHYSMANYISTKASVWENLQCGENVFIDEGTMLQPFVKIGDSSILFACSIGHHTSVGSHCLLSVTTTGGNVSIGDFSFIGMNSVIKQDTSIGEKNIIGMGCAIDKNTVPGAVYTTQGATKRSSSFEQVAKRFLK